MGQSKKRKKSDGNHIVTNAVEQELAKPFGERILLLLIKPLASLARLANPGSLTKHIKRQLVLAGSPGNLSLDKFLALKTLFFTASLLFLLLASFEN